MPGELDGRVALVTGGGTGLGRIIATALHGAGASLVLVGRRPEPLRETAEALGNGVEVVSGDVRDDATLDAALDRAWSALGGLDVLVNNAGGQFIAPAELISRRGWEAVIDVDLTATFRWSQGAALRWIAGERPGTVLNIVGPFRDRATPGFVHAGAARAAVVHLTRTLAVEWAPFGIRLNCLGPAVLTDGMRAEFAESDPTVLDELERRLPGGRWGTPDELAGTALFLCSDASSFVTGELLVMDGGAWAAQGLGMRAISGRRWSTEPDAGARRDWSGSLMGDEPA